MSWALKDKLVFWIGKGEKGIVGSLLAGMNYQMNSPHPMKKKKVKYGYLENCKWSL